MVKYQPTLIELSSKGPFFLDHLIDKKSELSIHLMDRNDHECNLIFDDYLAYRKIDEGDALKTLNIIGKELLVNHWFYLVDDSDFIFWFNKERADPESDDELLHYTITTIVDVIDVISLTPPEITMT